MESTIFYQQVLGLRSPWRVADVQLDLAGKSVGITVIDDGSCAHRCPTCGRECPSHDRLERSWRHLDTCQMQTVLTAEVPRVRCPERGVHLVRVPWAEPGSRFTAMFEAVVIDLLKFAPIKAVAGHAGVTWDQVDGIMGRAVQRGLARRTALPAKRLGVDETSFQRRHEYVTVVSDLERGIVLHVADDRKEETLAKHYDSLPPEALAAIEVATMDMWGPYIAATEKAVPEGRSKIAFDKFPFDEFRAGHLGAAVDKVRRAEHRELSERGDQRLKGTKHDWLRNPSTHDRIKDKARFEALRLSTLRTARAWSLKEAAMDAWEHEEESDVRIMLTWWCGWADRSRLEPMRKVCRMIKSHLGGIITAILRRATNACADSINSRIQWIKRMARGFRNRDRFRNAIYFHLGGLELRPEGLFHTKA
jgi:transposase